MKRVPVISFTVLLLLSCKTKESLTYVDENGEFYPTIESIDQMYIKRDETGLSYVWFNCEWVTHTQRDSLSLIENERIFEKLIQNYDHH
jgi:hypothetical protein